MLYRKMFAYSFVLLLLNALFTYVIRIPVLTLIFWIVVGFLMNKVYLAYANNKIDKIKSANSEKSSSELKKICIEQGGTSFSMVLIGGVLISLLTSLVFFILSSFGVNTIDLILGTVNNASGSHIFNGTIKTDTDIVMLDEFDIEIPNELSANALNSDYCINYQYLNKSNKKNSCEFRFIGLKDYTSSYGLMNQMSSYYSYLNPSDVKTYKGNDLTWYTYDYMTEDGTIYYYATEKDGKVYLFEYHESTNDQEDCELYKDQVLSTIKEK